MSEISASSLEDKIRSRIEGVAFVEAVDQSGGCGQKFELTVVSSAFAGKTMVMRHRFKRNDVI